MNGHAYQSNGKLVLSQDRWLAEEGCWVVEAPECAAGCLLVATPRAPRLMDARYEQLVILLLEHGPGGSSGVILNRPCACIVEDLLGWGWTPADGSSSLEAAFKDERVYLGGFFPPARIARQPITCLHGHVCAARPTGNPYSPLV